VGLFDELKDEKARDLVTPGSGAATRLALERELEAWGNRRRLGPDYVYKSGGHFLKAHGSYYQGRELPYPTRDLEDKFDSQGGPILTPEHWGYWGVILHPRLVQWTMDTIGMPNLERPPGDTSTGITDIQDGHDFPLLKVAYDPHRTDLDGTPFKLTEATEELFRQLRSGQ
jgi:hypothetical protein